MLNAEIRTRRGEDIRERSVDYALRSIKLFRHLKGLRDETANILGKQFLRSATSIGAHLAEAHAGESKADFIHKFAGAQKEARESHYWLTLLAQSKTVSAKRLQNLLQETNELTAIITTIIVNAKRSNRQ